LGPEVRKRLQAKAKSEGKTLSDVAEEALLMTGYFTTFSSNDSIDHLFGRIHADLSAGGLVLFTTETQRHGED
jgi:hypothetical protein